ncbi:FliH/SctL family protein [Desulfothermus okinawensis JCM 13304]
MSSSKGRIIIGKTGLVIDEVEFSKKHKEIDLWDENTEKIFLEKIKQKASFKASKIIKNAQDDAKKIKQQAYDEGYREGLKKAKEEIDSLKVQMRDKFLSILNSIEREKENILKSHMDDILNLIFVSVNKITGIAYVEHRKEILEELLNSCLNEIKESKTVKVYVSKEDLPMVEELIEPLKGKYVDIKNWHLLTRDNIKAGEVVLDTGVAKVTDSFDKRYDMVKKILQDVEITG